MPIDLADLEKRLQRLEQDEAATAALETILLQGMHFLYRNAEFDDRFDFEESMKNYLTAKKPEGFSGDWLSLQRQLARAVQGILAPI